VSSLYQRLFVLLLTLQCQECKGRGLCNDATSNDLSYNTWTCKDCAGTGMREKEAQDGGSKE